MVTVVHAVYAIGVIGALLLAGHLSDWYGRRHLLLPALGIAIVSAIVFLASKSLSGLLVARLIKRNLDRDRPDDGNGLPRGTGRGRSSEKATPRKTQLTASAVKVGGLGIGALAAGSLRSGPRNPSQSCISSSWPPFYSRRSASPSPQRPEKGRHHAPITAHNDCRCHRTKRAGSLPRLSAPSCICAIGLFTGLAELFLSGTLHQPSHALAGAVVGLMFGAGVAARS